MTDVDDPLTAAEDERQRAVAAHSDRPEPQPAADDAFDEEAGYQPINWRTMDPDSAPVIWTELAEWIDWIRQRYAIKLDMLPYCWFRHGRLVEEFSALYTAWLVCFDPRDSGLGPIQWHERFHQLIQRLPMSTKACADRHMPERSPDAPPDIPDWDSWIRETHA
jgi:hypothetical protein